jgi:hypothetical protein
MPDFDPYIGRHDDQDDPFVSFVIFRRYPDDGWDSFWVRGLPVDDETIWRLVRKDGVLRVEDERLQVRWSSVPTKRQWAQVEAMEPSELALKVFRQARKADLEAWYLIQLERAELQSREGREAFVVLESSMPRYDTTGVQAALDDLNQKAAPAHFRLIVDQLPGGVVRCVRLHGGGREYLLWPAQDGTWYHADPSRVGTWHGYCYPERGRTEFFSREALEADPRVERHPTIAQAVAHAGWEYTRRLPRTRRAAA